MKPRITNGRDAEERARRILAALNYNKSTQVAGLSQHLGHLVARAKKAMLCLPKTSRPELRGQSQLYFHLKKWLAQDAEFYLSFGGAGDALLLLAACWDNPRARPIFFANSSTLTPRLFDAFDVKASIHANVMGQPWLHKVLDPVLRHPNFKAAAHLPLSLDYSEWKRNHQYFIDTMVTKTPWRQTLGVEPNPFQTPKVIVICPTGSTKDRSRQRFLTPEEYQQLANFYLGSGMTVLTCGVEADQSVYKSPKHPHAAFLSSDRLVSAKKSLRHSPVTMLRYVNSASLVVSPDTWLKTYSLLAGIPTVVILTRWSGRYRPIGEDDTDYVFLHPKLWHNIRFARAEEFVRDQKCLDDIPLVS